MSENIEVNALLTAEDEASAVIRRFKRNVNALQRSFFKPVQASLTPQRLQAISQRTLRTQNRHILRLWLTFSAMVGELRKRNHRTAGAG